MDKDTKILLMAVVIILVALVSFNLSDLTGKVATSNQASMTVTPTLLTFAKNDAAKIVTVKLDLGRATAVDSRVSIYRSNGRRLNQKAFALCRTSLCYKDDINSMYRYSVSRDLDNGKYYFVTQDKLGNTVKSNMFTVSK